MVMKKTRNTLLKGLCCFGLILGLTSCEKFLEETPHSFLAPENYYQNADDALSALVGAYVGLGDGANTFLARRVHYLTWFPADEAYTPTLAAQRQLDNFSFNADHEDVRNVWTHMYDAINRANIVVGRLATINMDENLKQQYIAEARFIRGLCYFYGVRLYGGIPLITQEVTSVDEVADVTRASVADIYTQVIDDLTAAADVLPSTNQQGRATKGAAKGLLAKAYLTRASSDVSESTDYQRCADLAAEVIAMPEHHLTPNYQDAIGAANKFNPESLFEWQADRILTPVGKQSIFGQFTLPRDIVGLVPEAGQTGESQIVSEIAFFNRYDDRDYRKESTFITSGINRQGEEVTWQQFTFPFPAPAWKYVDRTATTRNAYAFNANYVVLRLADVYLMRAEALNEINGPTEEAYAMINAIRERARNRDGNNVNGFPENLSGLTKEEFRDAVLNERAVELGFEGHRWFDLVRTKRLVEIIKAVHPDYPVAEKHYLFPIPADELIINPNLEQNPGW
ncbi:Starch-binding associating with outer membrane [Parapedobacter indicus]|uniref:Starch-binding associating with outer membrane n=2 Tax=Parapedobacter indicus TaxID=1477437 RepID=A0A1I3IIH6_9SPHI|nr:putative outer membrane starch-binding protein [Parapedobacter indicus]SFI47746.1 Starch-binding associating with outer membrane [Parapedobacter indicus]